MVSVCVMTNAIVHGLTTGQMQIGSALTEKNEMRDVGIGIINAILSTLILAMIALIAYMLTV